MASSKSSCTTLVALLGSCALALGSYESRAGTRCFWSIQASGQASGWAFNKEGILRLNTAVPYTGTQNGENPFEIALYIGGDPATQSDRGNLRFASNSALLGGTASLDTSYVGIYQGWLYAVSDPSISAIGINVFNVNSGLTADMYQINGGVALFKWDSNLAATGIIQFKGTGSIFYSQNSYNAQFSGNFLGCQSSSI